jgi:hypothetical protein
MPEFKIEASQRSHREECRAEATELQDKVRRELRYAEKTRKQSS